MAQGLTTSGNQPQAWPLRLGRLALRGLARMAWLLAWLWVIGAAWYSELGPTFVPILMATAVAIGFPLAWYRWKNTRRRTALVFLATFLLALGLWTLKRPKTDAYWVAELAQAPTISLEGDQLTIEGLRDCVYRTKGDFDLRYRIETYDLAQLETLDLLVERFHPWNALAHTLLTFGFSDGRHVVISVEVRREIGESFDPIAGLFRQLELMYVLGTESDLIGLRTNFRKSHAWLYPIRTTKERIRKLFRSMLARAKHLQTSPEFYNTLTSTCTTNIVDHVLDLAPDRFDPDWRVLLPGYVATLAYEAGLIDTDLSFDAMQEAFRIDDIAQAGPVDTVYSQRIRSGRPARVTGEPPR